MLFRKHTYFKTTQDCGQIYNPQTVILLWNVNLLSVTENKGFEATQLYLTPASLHNYLCVFKINFLGLSFLTCKMSRLDQTTFKASLWTKMLSVKSLCIYFLCLYRELVQWLHYIQLITYRQGCIHSMTYRESQMIPSQFLSELCT